MKTCIFFLASVCLVLASFTLVVADTPEVSIKWLGEITYLADLPSVRYEDRQIVLDKLGHRIWETGPRRGLESDSSVEIGLREDGVVVWRKK